jgi:hypothetical protein
MKAAGGHELFDFPGAAKFTNGRFVPADNDGFKTLSTGLALIFKNWHGSTP